ncbi:acetyl/propionyl/methylcrotonyl-CoA carboxylase subunit alpha [Paraferrimonas sedimenticola]|uniref:Biotin carboxylase n=1 Tax=Paraferrimonas sedimenticola TaxID=375674 RepID=A0AA37RT30_9GAMM|nr:acetyl/propionyl/methylcrotonyl-CoA carboxylase subunit alpha [Paraferrimonas sedimenticola]GLP95385.1 3-methylcrotonyl-CoA carboxylase subunit alpha [Paraferrimonas sedimenticola]
MFAKILIANRGEIACRVIQTAKQLGVATVAVYSEADRHARHVQMADEAFLIGPAPSAESYLQYQRIIDCAKRSGAEAIHPGYGFLSENSEFAKACEANDIRFIGPGAKAIELMGSKSAAKEVMGDAGVPLVPGYHGDEQDDDLLLAEAKRIGYPLMVKAAFGGGGKGMRLVHSHEQVLDGIQAARREAMQSFGDDTLLLEAFIQQPRHVEVQVFADIHGNAVYLGDRDCSVQRRHQKVVEEAPAPGLSDELRVKMGEAAVRAAKAINYVGAGTVEFLLDARGGFYFMEMNTRLQVEHPVTEMTSGQDLVEWQLLVANGQTLPLEQSQIGTNGHSLEVRVYAEDPQHEFLPATGHLSLLKEPEQSEYVRVDTGVRQGDDISRYYDPMIAKLIVWDVSRERALNRMQRALSQYRIGGIKHNLSFLSEIITHPAFVAEKLTTGFIEDHALPATQAQDSQEYQQALRLAGVYLALVEQQKVQSAAGESQDPSSPWSSLVGWQLNAPAKQSWKLLDEQDALQSIQLSQCGGDWQVRLGTDQAPVLVHAELTEHGIEAELDGYRLNADVHFDDERVQLFIGSQSFAFELPQTDTGEGAGASDSALNAPMNGTVVSWLAQAGQSVEAGEGLMIMEAMKMEYTIAAPKAGVVDEFLFQPGDMVSDGAQLVAMTFAEEQS